MISKWGETSEKCNVHRVILMRKDPPDDIPLQHLRAAEQHLAALERWLRGEGKGVDNAG